MEPGFFIAGGTLRQDADCYIERQADQDLLHFLNEGQFCYVLTSRQMGKSSLMVRTMKKLAAAAATPMAVDLTAVGQMVTPEQWYNGILNQLGKRLDLEDLVESYWLSARLLSPVQRLFRAIQEVILGKTNGALVIFVDEIDAVRSLPFSSDEFFGAIRECYNRRSMEREYERITFCLLGVATPSELVRDARAAPFNIGRRIDLADFTWAEASRFSEGLSPDKHLGETLLKRILFWTRGHPYLTQRLCQKFGEAPVPSPARAPEEIIDELCEQLFLSSKAQAQDTNLQFVREKVLRTEADLTKLICLYQEVLQGQPVADDEANDLVKQLRMAGLVRESGGLLQSRNPIYARVFDQRWIDSHLPSAQLERPNGERVDLRPTCTIGRAVGNDLVLPDAKVSRRHALIQVQRRYQFWLVDLGSSNGTFVNGRRIGHPVPLTDGDHMEIGPFEMIFRQQQLPPPNPADPTSTNTTQPTS